MTDPVYTSTCRTLSGALCDMERVIGDVLYGGYVGYNGRGPGVGSGSGGGSGGGGKGDGRHTLLAYFEILELSGLLGVDRETCVLAVRIFRYTAGCTSLRNRSVESLATAAFVAAVERRRYEYNEWRKRKGDDGGGEEGEEGDWRFRAPPPLTLLEVSEAAGIDEKEVQRGLRVVNNALQRQRPENSASVATHMPEFCRRLGLPDQVKELAQFVTIKALEFNVCVRRNPISISAAAIYLACQVHGVRKTQTEICKVTALTEVTLRKVYKELAANSDRLLPPNCERFVHLKDSQSQVRDKSIGAVVGKESRQDDRDVISEGTRNAVQARKQVGKVQTPPLKNTVPIPNVNKQDSNGLQQQQGPPPPFPFPHMSGEQMQQQFQQMMQMMMQGVPNAFVAQQSSTGTHQTSTAAPSQPSQLAPQMTSQLPSQLMGMLPPPPPPPPRIPIPLMNESGGAKAAIQSEPEPKVPPLQFSSQVAESGLDLLNGEKDGKGSEKETPETPVSQADGIKPLFETEVSQKQYESQFDLYPPLDSQNETPVEQPRRSLLKPQAKVDKQKNMPGSTPQPVEKPAPVSAPTSIPAPVPSSAPIVATPITSGPIITASPTKTAASAVAEEKQSETPEEMKKRVEEMERKTREAEEEIRRLREIIARKEQNGTTGIKGTGAGTELKSEPAARTPKIAGIGVSGAANNEKVSALTNADAGTGKGDG